MIVLKPNIVTTKLESNVAIQATYQYSPTITALVIMDTCEAEALMRFTVSLSYNGLSLKAATLIDNAASLAFASI